MKKTPRLTLTQRVAPDGKPITGRFIGRIATSLYIPRILRGSIELPHERKVRAKAEAKRSRKAARRLAAAPLRSKVG